MDSWFDVVCVGDVTQDNFFFINDASVQCDLNNANCELILRYGNKIAVEKFAQELGGNAANVAVGLARLGLKAGLVTVFGNDERGEWIKRRLLQENVNVDYSLTENGRESNLSSVIVFRNERTILSFHSSGQQEIEYIPPARWVYLTSSPGRSSEDLFAKVLAYKQQFPEVQLAFNPYSADLKKGGDFLRPVVEQADILLVNKEELEQLGYFGPKITAVTDGRNGAKVFEAGQEILWQPAPEVEVVETTGAGDAFASGFLAGYFYTGDWQKALSWGLANSGGVIAKIGAIEGLLTKEDIDSLEKLQVR